MYISPCTMQNFRKYLDRRDEKEWEGGNGMEAKGGEGKGRRIGKRRKGREMKGREQMEEREEREGKG